MPEQPKVTLLIETSRGYGRQLLLGVAKYSRLNGPWSFYVSPGDFEQAVPRVREWGAHGVIARVANRRMEEALLKANVPTIALGLTPEQLDESNPVSGFSELRTDSARAAELAAAHLMQRGFKHYAYVGLVGRVWSDRRELEFTRVLRDSGHEPHVYKAAKSASKHGGWEHERRRLSEWLADLPRPVGVMACNDDRGREVLDACALAGVAVPEDAAVIGIDDDEVFCELSNPPLSSVAWNGIQAGYRAAQLLSELMANPSREPGRLTTEALRVITRRSTDIVALEDREVATALQFIHERRGRDMSVDDVAYQAAVSRRYLETRFHTEVGRTIFEEIQRVKLEHARRLLQETDYAIPAIAEASGYNSAGYLIQVFRKHFGITPAKYRASINASC